MINLNITTTSRLDEALEKLHRTFQNERRVVLTGREGAGKSTLAREYTRRFGAEYRVIAWIDAATDETFLADLYTVLQRCTLPVKAGLGAADLFQTLHTYLNEQRDALLVLDHLPFAFKMQDSFEQLALSYHFLLITHQENTPSELCRLDLSDLEARAGALLLLHQAGLLAETEVLDTADSKLQQAALELARELRGSPLALRLAAGYLSQSGESIQDYLERFRAYPGCLQLAENGQEELAVAGEICLTWLEQKHPETRDILQTCALCLPSFIPEAWFQQDEAEATARMQIALQLLIAVGLLEMDRDGTGLSMHPLLQRLTGQFYSLDKQPHRQEQIERLLLHLQKQLPGLADGALSERLRVVSHIRHLSKLSDSWENKAPEAAEVFAWAAGQLWEQHILNQAEGLLRKALKIWERAEGSSPFIIATVQEKLAALNAQAGNYTEAQALGRQALTSKIAAHGIQHPEVLRALLSLGQYYAAQRKENEAEACYKKAIAMGEALSLRHDLVYSAAKYHLALLFIEQGKWEQAEDLLLRVSAVRGYLLSQSHPSTREAQFKLAEVAVELKHWERAERAYQQALPAYAEELGHEHPLILDYQEQAALVMYQLGKMEEAKNAWQSILAVRERMQEGAQIACLNGLARVALAQGRLADALELLKRAQEQSAARSDEAESLVRAEMFEALAEAHAAGDDYRQAEQAASKALEERERVLGTEHLDLTESLSRLAKLKREIGEREEAEQLLQRALRGYRQEKKPEDMRLDPVLKSLAEIETERQHFERAKMYLQRLRAIRGLSLTSNDPRIQEVDQLLAENASARDLPLPDPSVSRQ